MCTDKPLARSTRHVNGKARRIWQSQGASAKAQDSGSAPFGLERQNRNRKLILHRPIWLLGSVGRGLGLRSGQSRPPSTGNTAEVAGMPMLENAMAGEGEDRGCMLLREGRKQTVVSGQDVSQGLRESALLS